MTTFSVIFGHFLTQKCLVNGCFHRVLGPLKSVISVRCRHFNGSFHRVLEQNGQKMTFFRHFLFIFRPLHQSCQLQGRKGSLFVKICQKWTKMCQKSPFLTHFEVKKASFLAIFSDLYEDLRGVLAENARKCRF